CGMNSGSAAKQAATDNGKAHLEIFRRRLEQCAFAGDENLDAAANGFPDEILRSLALLLVFVFRGLQDAPKADLRRLVPTHAALFHELLDVRNGLCENEGDRARERTIIEALLHLLFRVETSGGKSRRAIRGAEPQSYLSAHPNSWDIAEPIQILVGPGRMKNGPMNLVEFVNPRRRACIR